MRSMNKNISKNLRIARAEQGVSQKRLAELSGLSQSTIAQIEARYKQPSINALTKIATALNKDVTFFFTQVKL